MKTILVPTHHIATMKSALEVAVLLARRTGAYIEGFPLRIAIPPYVVAELTAGFAVHLWQRHEHRDCPRQISPGSNDLSGLGGRQDDGHCPPVRQ
jgi:hypothetical protein